MWKYLMMIAVTAFLQGCSKSKGLKVMASPIPHAEMLEYIKPDLAEQGFDLQIIVIEDYNIPNRALADKEINANFFQHLPFLDEQIRIFNYPIESYAKIEIEPMGLYSKKYRSAIDIPDGATIAIPSDPTNEGRALLLLQSEGMIQLERNCGLTATPLNIISNPKRFKFREIDAGMLPRALEDVDSAVINANYALQAGLNPESDALALENKDSPYVNVLAIHIGDADCPDLVALKKAMTSDKMKQFILEHYKGFILPAF